MYVFEQQMMALGKDSVPQQQQRQRLNVPYILTASACGLGSLGLATWVAYRGRAHKQWGWGKTILAWFGVQIAISLFVCAPVGHVAQALGSGQEGAAS